MLSGQSLAKANPKKSRLKTDTDDTTLTQDELPPGYKKDKFIASGSYGLVYSAVNTLTNETVAVKKITGIFDCATNTKRFLREIKLLRALNHPNVVKLKTITLPVKPQATFDSACLVFERGSTDLYELFRSDQYFTTLHVQYLLYQILCGVNYLHSAKIIHRDLKPTNILVNGDCSLKICDLGLSRATAVMPGLETETAKANYRNGVLSSVSSASATPVQSTPPEAKEAVVTTSSASLSTDAIPPPPSLFRLFTQHVATRHYRSPELMLLTERPGTAMDMWSVGCILAELLMMQKESGYKPGNRTALFPGRSCFPFTKSHPDDYQSPQDQLNLIFDLIGTPSERDLMSVDDLTARQHVANLKPKQPCDLNKKFSGADPLAIDLLKQLLVFDPALRITARDALKHPFLMNERDDKMEITAVASTISKDSVLTESLIEYYRYEIELEKQLLAAEAKIEATEELNELLQQGKVRKNLQSQRTNITQVEKRAFNDDLARQLIMTEIRRYHKSAPEAKEAVAQKDVSMATTSSALAVSSVEAGFFHQHPANVSKPAAADDNDVIMKKP